MVRDVRSVFLGYLPSLTAWCVLMTACGAGVHPPPRGRTATVSKTAPLTDLAAHVDPFIGTGGHGHTFPGPTTPFGLVQLSPDTDTTEWDWCAGYHYDDSSIMGFSHTHMSGAGAGDLGDVLVMPFTGDVKYRPGKKDVPGDGFRSRFSHAEEHAEVGYYGVTLQDYGVFAELTATPHAGVHRYTFRQGGPAHIALDLFHSIHSRRTVESEINLVDDHTITGFRTVTGWAPLRHVYFAASFSKPWNRAQIYYEDKKGGIVTGDQSKSRRHHVPQGAMTWFDAGAGDVVMVKVAISTTGITDAMASLARETPDWDFERVRAANRRAWNVEFGKARISAAPKVQTLFYTSLYRALMAPNDIADVRGAYPGPDNAMHRGTGPFYSTFSLWDTHRALHPLLTILEPARVPGMVRSLLASYDEAGTLPLWTLWGVDTNAMIGNPAVPVLVDAYRKGVAGEAGTRIYNAIRTTLTREHYFSPWALYDRLGYLPEDTEPQSVSRTLEAARDDLCAARMATAVGANADAKFFAARAQNYRHLFDPETAFFRGKDAAGRWETPFDPHAVNPAAYTEATAWQYRFAVPQDVPALVALMGGPNAFAAHLEEVFQDKGTTVGNQLDITGMMGQYAHGNEPSHHMAYLFDYAGMPWRSQYYVSAIRDAQYDVTPAGLAGNEDCGQLSAWYVLSALGIYQVDPCGGDYALGSPAVDRAELTVGDGRMFTVIVHRTAPSDVYIQGATWNGAAMSVPFLSHTAITDGGTLELTLGSAPREAAFSPSHP